MKTFTDGLVPDRLWDIVAPLIPPPPKRNQGGGIARIDDRTIFCAIVFVLTSGCAWRHLPPSFGLSHQAAHRRFSEWSQAGLWAKFHGAVLDRLGAASQIDWARAIVDAASLRAKRGGSLTGPNPVDRGKQGSKIHVLTKRRGLPLALGISAANLHDSQALEPLVQGIPKIRSPRGPRRRKPAKLHADKAYDTPACHVTLRERGIGDRIARIGIESSTRLGRHRWAVERTIAWLGGYRRLTVRYERHGHLFAAFLALAAVPHLLQKTRQLRHALSQLRPPAAQLEHPHRLQQRPPRHREHLHKSDQPHAQQLRQPGLGGGCNC